jgi:transposase
MPISWKEGKVVMLPKPVKKGKEKLELDNWRPIILINAMYRITFWIIARWFRDLHKERTDDAKK